MKVIAYHGSRVPYLKEFDWMKQGTGVVSSTRFGGFFFTSCPENAEFYADTNDDHPWDAWLVRVELTFERPFLAEPGQHVPTVVRGVPQDYDYDDDDNIKWLYDGIVCPETLDGCNYSDVYFACDPATIKIIGYGRE